MKVFFNFTNILNRKTQGRCTSLKYFWVIIFEKIISDPFWNNICYFKSPFVNFNFLAWTHFHCNKAFGTSGKLKEHVDFVHEGLKNHTCDLCGKAFGKPSDLKRHIISVHEKLRNFKCEKCPKAFCQLSTLNMHVRTIHEGVSLKINLNESSDLLRIFSYF